MRNRPSCAGSDGFQHQRRGGLVRSVVEIDYPRLGDFGSFAQKLGDVGHDGLDVLVGQLALVAVIDLDLCCFHIRTVMSASAEIS